MTFQPLAWQVAAQEALLDYEGQKGRIVVAATGAGKTSFGLWSLIDVIESGARVLWIAHRQELVTQPMATLGRFWPELASRSGILAASLGEYSHDAQVLFASKATIARPNHLAEYLKHGVPDVIVTDEVHHARSKSYIDLLDQFPRKTKLLGLTATPGSDGARRLSDRWDLVFAYPLLDAVADGVLVAPWAARCRIPELDLSRVEMRGNDYDQASLDREMVRAHIVEHTVDVLTRSHRAHRLPFRDETAIVDPSIGAKLVFTVSVEQAQRTAEALSHVGIQAAAVWGEMKNDLRRKALSDLERGRLDCLCSADALLEGTDLPVAKVGVIARPTRSHTLFVQMSGRILRKYGSSDRGLLLDLVGATGEHSLVSAPVLVDGVDCPESDDGQHRYLKLESGEGRCQSCGHLIRCIARSGVHKFKAGTCVTCGATQCPRSPTREHTFIPWEGGKRVCFHCALEIPDPMAAMVLGSFRRKLPVQWRRLQVPGEVYAALCGKHGILFNARSGDGWLPAVLLRGKLTPLAPKAVPADLARLLTDDVARQSRPKNGVYGAHSTVASQRIFMIKATHYAKRFRLGR